jgi:hypothetical protein
MQVVEHPQCFVGQDQRYLDLALERLRDQVSLLDGHHSLLLERRKEEGGRRNKKCFGSSFILPPSLSLSPEKHQ